MLSDNYTYLTSLNGSVLLPAFIILYIFILIAGAANIICVLNISIKKQIKYFAVLSSFGCDKNEFYKIIALTTLILTVISLPAAISGSLIFLNIVFGGEAPELFILTVKPLTVIAIIILSFLLIFISTYIPLNRMKKIDIAEAMSLNYSGSRITHKIKFELWYLLKAVLSQKSKVILLTLSTSACFVCFIVLFYLYSTAVDVGSLSVYGMEQDFVIDNNENENREERFISDEAFEKISKTEGVVKAIRLAESIDCFGYSASKDIFTLHLSDKKVFDEYKENRFTENSVEFMEAGLAYRDTEALEFARSHVVEGDFDCIYKDTGKADIIDNTWKKDDPGSYHAGDELIIELMNYDRADGIYTPVGGDGNKFALDVGAVIKDENSDHYRNPSDFPIYVSSVDFERITGENAITEIIIDCDDSSWMTVDQNLKKLSVDEGFFVKNNIDNNMKSENLLNTFIKLILILVTFILITVFIVVFVFNGYHVSKREKELKTIYDIGISKRQIYSIFAGESFLYSLLSVFLFYPVSVVACYGLYDLWDMNPIFYSPEIPVWILAFAVISCFFINTFSILSAAGGCLRRIKSRGAED
jgi:putative ABC transport system permease protein